MRTALGVSRARVFGRLCLLAALCLGVVFLGACEKKNAPRKAAPSGAGAGAPAPAQPEKFVKPTIADVPPFLYIPEGKKDPFKSLVVSREEQESPVDIAALSPLQVYDAMEHKVIAIVGVLGPGEKGMTAMIVRPDGKGFTVMEGTPIGNRGGRVVQIGVDSVVIQETVPDYRGNPTVKTVNLELRKEAQ